VACCNSRLLGGQEIHHQLGNQLRLIVLHLVASIGHIVKLDVGEHFFQLPAERHRTLEHPELFKTCILVDTNTLAPGISKNETVIANPPLPALAVRVNGGCCKGTPSAMNTLRKNGWIR
jgi:hypothetical protein